MTATTNGGMIRMALAAAWILAVALSATEASACTMGDEACPAILRMARGDVSIIAEGFVSVERPNYYYEFDTRAGQKMTVTVVGGNIKTGPGDAVDENTPYTLPATGTYVILMHANTMSDGPFGKFSMTLTIK
jgi:hypothetical protein